MNTFKFKLGFVLLIIQLVFSQQKTNAQISFYRDTVVKTSFPVNGTMQKLYDTIYNTSNSDIVITWQRYLTQIPTGWTLVGYCDPTTCYTDNANPHTLTVPANSKSYIYTDLKCTDSTNKCAYVYFKVTWGGNTEYLHYIHTVSNDASECITSMPTSQVDIMEEVEGVSVYPNPSSGYLNIKTNSSNYQFVNIYDIRGVKLDRIEISKGMNTLDLHSLPKQLYYLSFEGEGIKRNIVRIRIDE